MTRQVTKRKTRPYRDQNTRLEPVTSLRVHNFLKTTLSPAIRKIVLWERKEGTRTLRAKYDDLRKSINHCVPQTNILFFSYFKTKLHMLIILLFDVIPTYNQKHILYYKISEIIELPLYM